MNLVTNEVVHFSEDYSFLEDHDSRPTKVEFLQYSKKDFDFWTKTRVDRSVSRYISSELEERNDAKSELHPMEDASIISAPTKNDAVIDFPDVFQTKLVGEKSVNTLQEWECIVEEIDDTSVWANGISLIDHDAEENYLEIPLTEFATHDRELLLPGVVFRLIIGYAKKPSGQRTRESICYVRRALPSTSTSLDGISNL